MFVCCRVYSSFATTDYYRLSLESKENHTKCSSGSSAREKKEVTNWITGSNKHYLLSIATKRRDEWQTKPRSDPRKATKRIENESQKQHEPSLVLDANVTIVTTAIILLLSPSSRAFCVAPTEWPKVLGIEEKLFNCLFVIVLLLLSPPYFDGSFPAINKRSTVSQWIPIRLDSTRVCYFFFLILFVSDTNALFHPLSIRFLFVISASLYRLYCGVWSGLVFVSQIDVVSVWYACRVQNN